MPSEHQATITAQGLGVLANLMRERGLDWEVLSRRSGLDPGAELAPETPIPFQSLLDLLEIGARETQDDAFGLTFGDDLPVNFAGIVDYIILNAPSLKAALHDVVRYVSLVVDAYQVEFEDGEALSYLRFELPELFGPRSQFVDCVAVVVAKRIRHIVGDPTIPLYVELERSAPQNLAVHHRLLGRNVKFAQPVTRIGVEKRHLSRPVPLADPQLYRIIEACARQALAQRAQSSDLVYRVSSYIADSLKRGETSLPAAAAALGVSPRTLQRELEMVRTNFRELTEDTRKAMARHFLYDTALPLTEIAFLVGFSELSAFSRAAKGWFGDSPRELRKNYQRPPV